MLTARRWAKDNDEKTTAAQEEEQSNKTLTGQ